MICDKCGMQNSSDAKLCKKCKTPMPGRISCGGFADILTYKNNEVAMPSVGTDVSKMQGADNEEMKILNKKTDNVIELNKRGILIGLIALGVSCAILLCSVIFGIITMSKIDGYEAQVSKIARETKDEKEDNNTYKQDEENKKLEDEIKVLQDKIKKLEEEKSIMKKRIKAFEDESSETTEKADEVQNDNIGADDSQNNEDVNVTSKIDKPQ